MLRDQIARTRGNLASENLLGQLAQQFGQATGRGRLLRDALGAENAEGKWEAHKPDPKKLARTREPHARGAILVAAVFGAFLKIYRSRTVDLFRIASQGTGILPDGEIHPDLANRLADEAARSAQSLLQMCIRAIDYCPPVGITFGDYLRAIITADYDLNPEDRNGYRLAIAESMREWGIYPAEMKSVSVGALLWPSGNQIRVELGLDVTIEELFAGAFAAPNNNSAPFWHLESDRYKVWQGMRTNGRRFHKWLTKGAGRDLAKVFNLVLDGSVPATVSSEDGIPLVEVHSVRTALRRTPRGGTTTDLVVEVLQKRTGYFDPQQQKAADAGENVGPGDFTYRAGSTLIVDDKMNARRVVRTAGNILDDLQMEAQRSFRRAHGARPLNEFRSAGLIQREPFAVLHRGGEG